MLAENRGEDIKKADSFYVFRKNHKIILHFLGEAQGRNHAGFVVSVSF
jgi:hypothetical protein